METYILHHSHLLEQAPLPSAMTEISKAVPALATGTTTEIGLNKIFGKGITIPKKFIAMLPLMKKELTKAQIDQINRVYQ